MITLTLDNNFNHGNDGEEEDDGGEEEETPWSQLSSGQDARKLHSTMNQYKDVLAVMRNNTALRKIMEESGKLAFDTKWELFNNQHFTNNNKMAHTFISTLFDIVRGVIGKRDKDRISTRKVKSMYKTAKPYQQWCQITTLFEQYVATKRRLTGLTMAQTESFIGIIMETRGKRYIAIWEEERRKEIKRLLRECQIHRKNGNHYEAQKCLAKATNTFSNRPAPAKRNNIRVLDPITNKLARTDKEAANGLMNYQEQVEREKLARYQMFDLGLTTPPPYLALNRQFIMDKEIDASEMAQTIAACTTFKTGGPDGIPMAI
ncbi:MAG: hypothetical protein ACRC0O_14760, partial [Vibrio metschnikovii]